MKILLLGASCRSDTCQLPRLKDNFSFLFFFLFSVKRLNIHDEIPSMISRFEECA